ncbi:Leucine-rich repeat containing protein [Entamoeba marina]
MKNFQNTPLPLKFQSKLKYPSYPFQPKQFTNEQLMIIVPYLSNISTAITYLLVSKKCASSILLSTTNPYYNPDQLNQEISLFKGLKLLRLDISTLKQHKVPSGIFLDIRCSYHDFEGDLDWNTCKNLLVSLELQCYKEIDISFRKFPLLHRLKIFFWDQLSDNYIESCLEELLHLDQLQICIIDISNEMIPSASYAINQLSAKGVKLVVKIHNMISGNTSLKPNEYLQICCYSNELNDDIINGNVILLPEDKKIQITSTLANSEESLNKVIYSYYPVVLEIKGKKKGNSVIDHLQLSPFNCIQQLYINNVITLNQKSHFLPTTLNRLSISYCGELRSASIPSSIENLHINNCHSITLLPILPNLHLKQLKVEHCNNLKNLQCCSSLTLLDLKFCTTLSLLTYPYELKELQVQNCYALKQINNAVLSKLVISGCSINNLVEVLSIQLEELKINASSTPKSITLPTTLKRLELTNCDGLVTIPNLHMCKLLPFKTLQKYNSFNCKKIKVGGSF